MIHIVICPDIICITGHAGAGPPGHDLVCAAVSTLVQTFVQSAEQLTDTQLHSDIAPGGAFVRYEGSPQMQLLADSFFVGVQGVAEAYPQCVQVLDRRKRRAEALTAEKQGEDPAKNGQKL